MADENENPLDTPVTSLTYKDPDDGEWKIAEASVDDLAIRLALNTLRPCTIRPLYGAVPSLKLSHVDNTILENTGTTSPTGPTSIKLPRFKNRAPSEDEMEKLKSDLTRMIELHALRDEAERGTQATERMRLGEGLKSLCDWRKQMTAEAESIQVDVSRLCRQTLQCRDRLDALEKLHSQGPTTGNVPATTYSASSEACPKPKGDRETYDRIIASDLMKELTELNARMVGSDASKGKTPAETRESILEKADRQLSDAMQCLAVALHAKASMLTPEDRAKAEVACPTCHSYTVCPTCRGRPWSEVKKDKQ